MMCLHADARARACADEAHTPRAQGKMCDQSALEPYKLGGGKQVTAAVEKEVKTGEGAHPAYAAADTGKSL